jgi:transcriptional/translational regulatory protein YebC/TACO1
MAEPGAVAYLFSTLGYITVAKDKANEDELMLTALDAGASDVTSDDEFFTVITDFGDLWAVREKLEAAGVPIADSKVVKVASTTIELSGKDAETMMNLVDALEDLDDVQNVWSNFDLDDATAAAMAE